MRLMRFLAWASASVIVASDSTALGAPPSGRVIGQGSQAQAMIPALNTGFMATSATGKRISVTNGFVDCNGNGIDDSTDIANCDGDPACDDCNINGVPDGCDIADGTSQDEGGDGVPDECGSSVITCGLRLGSPPSENKDDSGLVSGGCLPPLWSGPQYWNLGGLYPNDLDPINGQAGVFVTIVPGQSLTLDVDAWIPSLRLTQSSQLLLTTPGDNGDLGISPPAPDRPGRILVRGGLQLGDGRTIGPASGALSPDITIDTGGVVAAADPNLPTSATLTAGNMVITGEDCLIEPCEHSGLLDLTEGMSLTADGDVTVDGSRAYGECVHAEGTVASFHVPPSIRVRQSQVIVNGSLSVLGAGSVAASESTMSLGGDFNNQSVRPECFDCQEASLILDGKAPQFFEVATKDIGPVGSLDGVKYAMGVVTVASGRTVTFRDNFDNDQAGQTPCSEALYVGTLTLGGGSNISIEGSRIYSQRLFIDSSVTVSCTCDHCLQTVASADADGDGLVQLSDWAFATQCMWGPEEAVPYSCLLFDLHADDHVDLRDAAIMQRMITP